jgi:hypothetical protein
VGRERERVKEIKSVNVYDICQLGYTFKQCLK